MQEHEYMYEYGQIQEYTPAQEAQQIVELSGQEGAIADEFLGEKLIDEVVCEDNELEEIQDQRATLRLGRALTVGFGLSFLACLAALWFSSTLLSAPDQILPVALLQQLAANRVLVLCVPAACLVICSLALRSLTGEIMAVPERKLDERQKVLRDQAQRSAFKILKLSSLLIPIAFVLPHLPWFDAPSQTPFTVTKYSFFTADGNPVFLLHKFGDVRGPHMLGNDPFAMIGIDVQIPPAIQPASTPEIMLAGGVLLLCLLLLFSALPMAVLAWKGKA